MAFKMTVVNGKVSIRSLPNMTTALNRSGKQYISRYKERIHSGLGVENSRAVSLTKNPDWINALRGSDSPLLNTGSMSSSLLVNNTGANKVSIQFNSSASGQSGAPNNKVASRMQFGTGDRPTTFYDYVNIGVPEVMDKYGLWPSFRSDPDRLQFESFSVTARPHFFTTTDDRSVMANEVWKDVRTWIKKGVLQWR